MKTPNWLAIAITTLLLGSAGIQKSAAQLATLDKQPWLGYFAVYENKHFQIAFSAVGKFTLSPINEKDKPVSSEQSVSLTFGIEEVMPDGKTRMKAIIPASLESTDAPTDKLVKTTIRGKVTGDATFVLNLEQDRGIITIGGHITDPGTLKANPIRFTVIAKLPNLYARDKKVEKKDIKAFEKKIKDDNIDLKWTDGKRHKETFENPVDLSSKEINGPGITDAEITITPYRRNKLYFTASPNSALTLSSAKSGPLHEGFSINWLADPAKDPDGKARLAIQVR